MTENILITDDEKEIADLLEAYLKDGDYNIFKAYDGKTALEIIRHEKISLAVLDIMLPDIDGFSLVREIRRDYNFPIIFLSARSEDMDKINGLTIGADDYMTKPFNPLEAAARIKTQLRRYVKYNANQADNSYDCDGLYLGYENHKCSVYGKEVPLTPIEFDILRYLCGHKGCVVTSEELFEMVWGEKYLDSSNTVMTHIARIREKMGEQPRRPKFIKTVWGVGYIVE